MARTVKRPEERRQEIIETAQHLFLQQGYEASTMQDVMKSLGVAKGTIYHYFQSKEELLEAVVQANVEAYVAGVLQRIGPSGDSALDRFNALVRACKVPVDERDTSKALHKPSNIGLHTRQLAVTISKLAPLFAAAIEQGCAEGTFQVADPLSCAEFFLAGLQFLTDSGCHPWRQEELSRRAAASQEILEKLLQVKKGSLESLISP